MSRREMRERAFKLLFRVEFNENEDMPEQVSLFFADEEELISDQEQKDIIDKYEKIMDKLPVLDQMIDEKADKWSVKRMGKVDLTLIRLALYEMEFDDDIPVGVAINEAVELAKKFGQNESSSFINGILAKFVK